jgi:uncharacterized membrane protein YfcA
LTIAHAIFLFFAGAIGGSMNAVAGGGSFIAFPALLFTGVGPIPANATNTLSLWVGTAASGRAYWNRLNVPWRVIVPLLVMSLVGGLAGALLLIRTPAQTFLRVIPWLMLGATLLFAFGRHLTRRIAVGVSHEASSGAVAVAAFFELAVAVYGGYFGGGIGILNLALLAALGMTDIHAMNALKVILVAVINGTAAATFVVKGTITWPQAMVMIPGAVLGGYSAAHFAQRLPQWLVRSMVIALGAAMTVYFFLKAYR